jgi:small subunit ribosomal protein S18
MTDENRTEQKEGQGTQASQPPAEQAPRAPRPQTGPVTRDTRPQSGRPPSRGGYSRGGGGRPRQYGRRSFTRRRKVCAFCLEKTKVIDYKDVGTLRRFVTERGKIKNRRKTGTCARHQRRLAIAIKRARHVALLPFTAEHIRQY